MAVKKAKTKAWYTIISPEIFGGKEIGKTTATDPAYLVGRIITTSAIEITNDFSKYYMKLKFRVNRVEGDKVWTVFDGSECMRDYISRMILRHVRRIDSVQDLKTSDNIPIRVKTLAVVSKKMNSSVVKVVRLRVQNLVAKMVASSTLEEFLEGMMNDNLKAKAMKEIRRIYPVRGFEFRRIEVLR